MRLVLWLAALQGGGDGDDRITLQPATEAVRIDGRLDDAAWVSATPIPLPYEVRPRENARAGVPTECRGTFDDRALYFGCVASDDPASIRAYLTNRDRIAAHDRIVVFIDPFADGRRGFFFNVNPLGVQQDGVFNGLDGQADLAWDAIWESAGRVTDDGYVVEMAIPFSSLRFPVGREDRPWRFFIERNWPRSDNVVLRSTRLDHANACNLCQAHALAGLFGMTPSLGARLTPTVTGVRTDRREIFPQGPMTAGPIDPEVGIGGRLRVTDDLTLNGTVNPDFSQVEADVAQLEVNEQFSLFFPEKRPFFLDGTEVFATPLRAAFTRTVASPVAGVSLTGKLGSALVASLGAADDRTTVLVPGNQGSQIVDLDRSSTHLLQRIRTDVGRSGTVGAAYTGRFASGYRNQVFGADAFFRLTPLVRVRGQVLQSETRDPGEISAVTARSGGAFAGTAAFAEIRRSDFSTRRSWFGSVQVTAKSPDFRADAGFEPQVDVRRVEADAAWNVWSNGAAWFTRLNFWVGGHRSETFAGRLNSEEIWPWFSYHGPRQTFFWLWPRWGRQFFAGNVFRVNYWQGSVSTQPADNLTVGIGGRIGDEIDFANARAGTSRRLSPNVQLRLARHIDLEVRHRLQRLEVDGVRVFTANVSEARVIYNFTSRAFLRTIAQLRHTDRDPAQYNVPVDRESTTLFTQLLFSYRINAQTGLFLGYADNRAGVEPETDPRVPLTQRDRTFFFKLSYAWHP